MASYAYWSLPMPVVAARGANISLNSILSLGFGSPPWTTGWLEADSSATIYNYAPSLPFSYWDPNAAAVGEWFVSNGATAFDSWTYANFANVSFTAGNAMGEYQHLDVTLSGPSNNPTGYIYYSFATVDPHVLSPTAGLGEPTAADIVASAYRFNAYYGNIPNTNDCHHIAEDVAAAAGATFPYRSANDTNPSANVDGGFWRVVYRGNVNGGVSNWHTLVQPGDIVRMHWDAAHGDGPHTTTILAVNPDGSMIVYDNGYYIGNSSYTGVHTVTYDQRTVAADITIYRLTSDGLYLSQGDDAGDAIPGTLFSDKLITGIGNDTSNGGRGNDVFQDAGGTNNFDGGGGRDKLIVNANFSATTTFTHSGTTWSIGGTGFSDTVRNIEVVQFNDRSVALQEDAHADFSGDGTSDIAFFNSAAGAVSFYEINPLGGYTWHNIGGVSTGYTPLAGDLNGDGIDDILWFNGTSVSAYLTNPAGGYAWRSIGSVSAGYT
ncbi:MAG: VCBS repeat-containing protein, partial [Hyphomicrobiales bacterium]